MSLSKPSVNLVPGAPKLRVYRSAIAYGRDGENRFLFVAPDGSCEMYSSIVFDRTKQCIGQYLAIEPAKRLQKACNEFELTFSPGECALVAFEYRTEEPGSISAVRVFKKAATRHEFAGEDFRGRFVKWLKHTSLGCETFLLDWGSGKVQAHGKGAQAVRDWQECDGTILRVLNDDGRKKFTCLYGKPFVPGKTSVTHVLALGPSVHLIDLRDLCKKLRTRADTPPNFEITTILDEFGLGHDLDHAGSMVAIADKLQLLDLMRAKCELMNVPVGPLVTETLAAATMWFMTNKMWLKPNPQVVWNYWANSGNGDATESYQGGFNYVAPGRPKAKGPVVMIDARSMYPSIILAYCISPGLLIGSSDDLELLKLKLWERGYAPNRYSLITDKERSRYIMFAVPDDVRDDPFLESVVELLERRAVAKAAGDEQLQKQCKEMVNSLYGLFAAKYVCYIYRKELAEVTAFIGRFIIMAMRDILDKKYGTVLTVDTDGCGVELNKKYTFPIVAGHDPNFREKRDQLETEVNEDFQTRILELQSCPETETGARTVPEMLGRIFFTADHIFRRSQFMMKKAYVKEVVDVSKNNVCSFRMEICGMTYVGFPRLARTRMLELASEMLDADGAEEIQVLQKFYDDECAALVADPQRFGGDSVDTTYTHNIRKFWPEWSRVVPSGSDRYKRHPKSKLVLRSDNLTTEGQLIHDDAAYDENEAVELLMKPRTVSSKRKVYHDVIRGDRFKMYLDVDMNSRGEVAPIVQIFNCLAKMFSPEDIFVMRASGPKKTTFRIIIQQTVTRKLGVILTKHFARMFEWVDGGVMSEGHSIRAIGQSKIVENKETGEAIVEDRPFWPFDVKTGTVREYFTEDDCRKSLASVIKGVRAFDEGLFTIGPVTNWGAAIPAVKMLGTEVPQAVIEFLDLHVAPYTFVEYGRYLAVKVKKVAGRKCCFCDRVHDRPGWKIYLDRRGNFVVTCFHARDGKGEVFKVPRKLRKVKPTSSALLAEAYRTLPPTPPLKGPDEFANFEIDGSALVCIRANMGCGKTERLKLLDAAAGHPRAVLLTARRTQGGDIEQRMNAGVTSPNEMVKSYLDHVDKGILDLAKTNRLSLQVDSLGKLDTSDCDGYSVYMDEAESILSQMRNAGGEIYAKFANLLAGATKVVAMDALITEASVKLFEQLSGKTSSFYDFGRSVVQRKCPFVHVPAKDFGTEVVWKEIEPRLTAGKNVYCNIAHEDMAFAIYELAIGAGIPTDKILYFNGRDREVVTDAATGKKRTRYAIKNSILKSNINAHIEHYGVRLFMHTSTISCGVDVSIRNHFHSFVHFADGRFDPVVTVQAMGRVRHFIEPDAGIVFYNGLRTDKIRSDMYDMLRLDNAATGDIRGGALRMSLADQLAKYLEVRDVEHASWSIEYICAALKQMGYELSFAENTVEHDPAFVVKHRDDVGDLIAVYKMRMDGRWGPGRNECNQISDSGTASRILNDVDDEWFNAKWEYLKMLRFFGSSIQQPPIVLTDAEIMAYWRPIVRKKMNKWIDASLHESVAGRTGQGWYTIENAMAQFRHIAAQYAKPAKGEKRKTRKELAKEFPAPANVPIITAVGQMNWIRVELEVKSYNEFPTDGRASKRSATSVPLSQLRVAEKRCEIAGECEAVLREFGEAVATQIVATGEIVFSGSAQKLSEVLDRHASSLGLIGINFRKCGVLAKVKLIFDEIGIVCALTSRRQRQGSAWGSVYAMNLG